MTDSKSSVMFLFSFLVTSALSVLQTAAVFTWHVACVVQLALGMAAATLGVGHDDVDGSKVIDFMDNVIRPVFKPIRKMSRMNVTVEQEPLKPGPFLRVYASAASLTRKLRSSVKPTSDVGKPLILTPFLDAGRIDEAKDAAEVQGLSLVPSYSGFFTVNKKYNANLFFWYFPAAYNPETAPVVFWLQGGPGASSLFGLFVENGPFWVDSDLSLNMRATSWTLPFNVVYFDQPVGTGYSFADDDAALTTCEDDIARDMYEAIKQFYTMFPQLLDNELYLTGESYAGKYVPAIAHKIHSENSAGTLPRLPLAGLAIGDGLCNPHSQLYYGSFLYQIGLVGAADRDRVDAISDAVKELIEKENWKEATLEMEKISEFYINKTGLQFIYNYMLMKEPANFDYYVSFLDRPEVRKAIHVGNLNYSSISTKVEASMSSDMPKSVKTWIEDLLNNNYKVMIYNGQLDLIINYPEVENFVSQLSWHGADSYRAAERHIWKVDGDVAGYVTEADNLVQVLVRNAGHMVPMDQPKWAFDMMQRFIKGKAFAAASA